MIMTGSLCRRAFAALIALSLSAGSLKAQSTLENALRQLGEENARGYLQPFADLFASDMSSGWYHTAMIPKARFGLGLELIAMGSKVEDKHRTYVATTPDGFDPATFTTATVFGGEGATVSGPGGTQYSGSDGIFDAEYLPAAAPQLRIGGIMGTEVAIRYFSSSLFSFMEEDDFPQIDLLGVGVRHSISQYMDDFPVDLAAGVFYSSLKMGGDADDQISADYSGLSVGVQASKSFSVLTLYGGLSSDAGKMELDFVSTDPNEAGAVNVDIDVERAMKFTIGAGLNFGPLRLFGDANFGPATTFSGGLRFGF